MIKQNDYIFMAFMLLLTAFLVIPYTHHLFFDFTNEYALLGGFIKFFLFASLGDIISSRIKRQTYLVVGLFRKMLIWGIIGVIVVIVFEIFPAGVDALNRGGLLTYGGNTFIRALYISVLMNLLFAPTMMLFHRITDALIELQVKEKHYHFSKALGTINFQAFIKMLLKTIPLFWIPAHTITFLLPGMYRAFFASVLGVMLGLFLNLFKKSQ